MRETRVRELERIALEVRKDVVRMVGVAKSHNLVSALTVVDLLVYMCWEHMKIFPGERNNSQRDRLVLSSGFAAPALYACLAALGFFVRDELWSYRRLGGTLQGYPDIRTPGVDAPGGTGGLGIALGLSLAIRMDGHRGKVFCIADDEEFCSGTIWESIDAAALHCPGNLFLVVELGGSNGDRCETRRENAESLSRKLGAFGWMAGIADCGDFMSMERAFDRSDPSDERPKAIIAVTGEGRAYYDALESYSPGEPLSADDVERTLSYLDTKANLREGGK
jgi:transketolase